MHAIGAERKDNGGGTRPVVYCMIPPDLAGKLHELLRRHFSGDDSVRVVVERRSADRRADDDRRVAPVAPPRRERRAIRSASGRRVADRRSAVLRLDPPQLPRRAQRYADRLAFLERVEPSSEHVEDADTARLVMRIQAGDTAAFADLYRRYFDRVYSYLRVVLRTAEGAEEATQHVFTKVLEALPRYERRRQAFSAWLFVVARNHAIDELKRLRRNEVVSSAELCEEGEPAGWAECETPESLDWLSDPELKLFIQRLPLPQRQALVLRYVLDCSNADIAEVLGRTQDDVRQLQSRALQFLRRRLAAVGRGPETRRHSRMRAPVRHARVARRRRFALMD